MFAIPSDWQARGAADAPLVLDYAKLRSERRRQQQRSAVSLSTITQILAVPRRVVLAGGEYVVEELRLIDYAELQAWLEERVTAPIAAEPAADPDARRRELGEMWDDLRTWPPRLGSAASMPHLATSAYRLVFLAVMLRRHHPAVAADVAGLVRIEAACTRGEWSALRRVGWAISPLAEVVAEVAPDPEVSPGTDWVPLVNQVAESRGYTQAEAGEMSLSFFRAAISGGKSPEQGSSFGKQVKRARLALKIPSKEQQSCPT